MSELLKLAAKAIGAVRRPDWNPIDDSAQALELEVLRDITVTRVYVSGVDSWDAEFSVCGKWKTLTVPVDVDALKSRRLVTTMAAAEIGAGGNLEWLHEG
jgi:hypothetical protein